MRKKALFALICCALLLWTGAMAEVPAFSEKLFKTAKQTLCALAEGDYDSIVSNCPFSDLSPDVKEWKTFAKAFSNLEGSEPQTRYAVAYWNGKCWKIAVPIETPSSKDVETLVLTSEDGKTFCGYACTSWGKVYKDYNNSEYVKWDSEYNASEMAKVVSDD